MSEAGSLKIVFDQGKLTESLARLKAELDKIDSANFATSYQAVQDRLDFFEEQRRQKQWATDPMRLMPWFTANQWRWFMADRITDLMEALNVLADWVTPD